MSERAGQRVGRYVLVRALEHGDRSWLAFDPALQRRVQLDLEATDDTGTARLAAARAVAKVHDAAIVAVHDVGDNEGMPFIAREYVASVEIERAAAAVTSVVELRRWLTELTSGLAAIHAGGVVHGGLGERGSLVIDAGRGRIGGFARGRVSVDAAARDDDVRNLRARISAALAAAAPVVGPRALASLGARIDATLPSGDAGALAQQLAADPRGRGTALVAAIAITAAIGFVALGRTLATAAAPECAPAAAEIPGVWDGDRAAALRDAFVATGSGLATEAAAATTRTLDGYAGKWSAMRADLCSSVVDDDAVRDAAMVCLDRRRAEVDALVRVLLAPDGEMVTRASQAALALAVVEDCVEPDADRPPDPPGDPVLREKAEQIHIAIADVHALNLAGRYARAVEVALAAQRVGGERIDDRLRARLALEIGIARGKAGESEVAIDELVQALALAWRTGSVALAADAWIEIAFAQGEYLKRGDEALLAIDLAAATLDHVQDRPRVQARLQHVRGVVLFRLDRNEEARDALALSLAIRDQLPSDDLATAQTLNSLANANMNLRRFDEAEPLYRRALAIYAEMLGHDHPDIAAVSNNLGALYYRTERLEDALVAMREAHRMRVTTLGNEHPDTVGALDNVGIVLSDLGRAEEALPVLESTLRMREHILPPGDPSIADSLVNYGNALVLLRRGADARRAFERALEIDLATRGEHHYATTVTMQNLGRALEAESRPAEALEVYERVLAVRDALPDSHDYNIVDTLIHVAESAQDSGASTRAETALARARGLAAESPMRAHADPIAYLTARERWHRGERAAARRDVAAIRDATEWPPFRANADAWLASHPE